jgi:hypothetical protein
MNIFILIAFLVQFCHCSNVFEPSFQTHNELSTRLEKIHSGTPVHSDSELAELVKFPSNPYKHGLVVLPGELLVRVFQFLLVEKDEFLNLRLVSRYFKAIVRISLIQSLHQYRFDELIFQNDLLNYSMYYIFNLVFKDLSYVPLNENSREFILYSRFYNFYNLFISNLVTSKSGYKLHFCVTFFIAAIEINSDKDNLQCLYPTFTINVLLKLLKKSPLPISTEQLVASLEIMSSFKNDPKVKSDVTKLFWLIESENRTNEDLANFVSAPEMTKNLDSVFFSFFSCARMAIISFCPEECGINSEIKIYETILEFMKMGYFSQQLFDRLPPNSDSFLKLFNSSRKFHCTYFYKYMYNMAPPELIRNNPKHRLLKYFWSLSIDNPFRKCNHFIRLKDILHYNLGEILRCKYPNLEQIKFILEIASQTNLQNEYSSRESFIYSVFMFGSKAVSKIIFSEINPPFNMFVIVDERPVHIFQYIIFTKLSIWKMEMYLDSLKSDHPMPLIFINKTNLLQVLPKIVREKKFDLNGRIAFDLPDYYFSIKRDHYLINNDSLRHLRHYSFNNIILASDSLDLKKCIFGPNPPKFGWLVESDTNSMSLHHFVETAELVSTPPPMFSCCIC